MSFPIQNIIWLHDSLGIVIFYIYLKKLVSVCLWTQSPGNKQTNKQRTSMKPSNVFLWGMVESLDAVQEWVCEKIA